MADFGSVEVPITDANIAAHTSTKITITDKAHLPPTAAYTDVTQTWSAQQTFRNNLIRWFNPGLTFSYTIGTSALTGNVTITLPLLTANDEYLFKNHPATLTGKAMSGLSNTFTNIPDSALSSNIPLLNAANVFSNGQKISTSTSTLLTFHRQVNTLGFGAGFTYDLNDSASAEATYGISYVGIEDNAAGAVRGDFYVQLAIAGTNGIRFRVGTGGDGGILFGNNQRVIMTEGGLTGQHVYTFPDVDTRLLGDVSPVVQNPIIKRTGTYTPTTPTTASATSIGELRGMLAQHVPTGPGTNTNTYDTTEGLLANLVTTSTVNQNAGLVSPTGALGVGRRLFGMKAILRSKVDTVAGSVSRLYFGFTSATAIPATDTPVANADSGIIVGFNSTDTNYQIRSNDGTGAATVTAITGNIPKNALFHTIQIEWAASGNIIVTFDGTAQTISTDLPLTTADLKFHCVAQNATGAIRTHSIKGVWLEADE